MSRAAALLLVAPLTIPISGCANAPEDAGFSDVAKLVDERSGHELHWLRDEESLRQADARVAELLRSELTVDAAVQIALLRNAELQATLEELGLARADLLEARLAANPMLEAEMRFPGDPRPPIEIHVIQDFLSVLTMPLRKHVAETQFERTKLDVAERVVRLVAEVKSSFVEAAAAGELLELRRQVAVAAGAAADAARSLLEAGNFTELQADQEFALEGRARLEFAAAEADLFERRARLDGLLGLWGAETGWQLPIGLPSLPQQEIAGDRIEPLAVAQRLDLAAARAVIDVQARALGVVHETAWIDELGIGLHYEREPNGVSSLGPSLSIPIPLFSRGPARTERGMALLRQAEDRYRALAVNVRAQARALTGRMLAARRRAEYLRDVVVPLQARLVQHSQLEYNAMQIGVFELLRAKQEEIDAGAQSIAALRDYWVARAELEHAVGGSLEQGEQR